MHLVRVVLVGRAVADVRARENQEWPLGLGDGRVIRFFDLRVIVSVDVQRAPAVGLEALGHVLAHALVEVAVERDLVVVVDEGEVAELQVAGERGRLGGHALHHVAVGDDAPHAMVEQPRKARLGHLGGERHADGVAHALAERPGGGLDAGREVRLGMARRLGAPLAEMFDLVE